MTADGVMAIGELSRQTGCNIETIRHYERIDLAPRPVSLLRRDGCPPSSLPPPCRELGFTLEEIRALFGIAAESEVACDGGEGAGCPLIDTLSDAG